MKGTEDQFAYIGPTLINISRLLVVGASPRVREGCRLAVFDTGQELVLSAEHADLLAELCQTSRSMNPPLGTMAITSEGAI